MMEVILIQNTDQKMQESLQMLLMRVTRNFSWKCMQRMSELDIQPRQLPMLMAITHQEGISQRELAEVLHNTPPTVNVSVQRLEKTGLVKRERDSKDQRKIHVLLTEQGKAVTHALREYMEETEEIMFSGFAEEEKDSLRQVLERVLGNIEEIPGESFPECPSGQKGEPN